MATPRATPSETTVSKRILKLGVGLVLIGVLGFLFLRSVRSTRAEPYTITRDSVGPWSLTLVAGARPNEAMLMLRPPQALVSGLFGQLFKRAMESMGEPPMPGIALVLQGEQSRAQADHPTLTPEALLAAARAAGLDAAAPRPICMAHRRATDGRDREQVYFVIFEIPAFAGFRERVAAQANVGVAPHAIDPALLSPAMMLATVESSIERWLPLHADPKVDCVAPIAITAAAE